MEGWGSQVSCIQEKVLSSVTGQPVSIAHLYMHASIDLKVALSVRPNLVVLPLHPFT